MSSISQLLKENNPHEDILTIAGGLGDKENIPTYIVGGYVRDTLLGKSCQDIDIMVEGDGVAFAKLLANELKVNVTVDYDKFGPALIPYPMLILRLRQHVKKNINQIPVNQRLLLQRLKKTCLDEILPSMPLLHPSCQIVLANYMIHLGV